MKALPLQASGEAISLLENCQGLTMIYSLAYLSNLLTDKNIASITPTSRFGVKRVCDKMDFSNCETIVEYGPATGVFTRYFLERLGPEAQVIAIDTNPSFLKILAERIKDKRLKIFNESAENVKTCLAACGRSSANYVVSGIPFSMLPVEVADRIVRDTHDILKPQGKFLVYQFLKPERPDRKGIHRYLPTYFSAIKKEVEMLNIPPLWVYEARKTAD